MTAFEHTTEGYLSAYEWLEDAGLLTQAHKSMDGFTLVNDVNQRRELAEVFKAALADPSKLDEYAAKWQSLNVGIDEGVPGGDKSVVNGVIEGG